MSAKWAGPAWLVAPASLDEPDEVRPWPLTRAERECALELLRGNEGDVVVAGRGAMPRHWRRTLCQMSRMLVRGPDWCAELFGSVAEYHNRIELRRVNHSLLRFVVSSPVMIPAFYARHALDTAMKMRVTA